MPELANLRVYIEHEGTTYLSFALQVSRTQYTHPGEFEVYIENFHDLLGGRDSLHSSGLNILRNDLVDRTVNRAESERGWRVRVAEIERLTRVSGIAFGRVLRDGSQKPNFPVGRRPDRVEDRRLAVTIPTPTYPHGYEVFAIPAGDSATLARLAETPPYAHSRVAAVLATNWLTPTMIAVVVWVGTDEPYQTSEWHHEETQSARFAVSPAAYAGTWVQDRLNSTDEDVMLHGPYRGPWLDGSPTDPEVYNFARDASGEVSRVIITETISAEEARARYPGHDFRQ